MAAAGRVLDDMRYNGEAMFLQKGTVSERPQADREPAWSPSPTGIRGSGRIEAVRRERRRLQASFVDRCLSQAT